MATVTDRKAHEEWHPTRVERCACGGLVIAEPLYPERGVREHNVTYRHLNWRMRLAR